MSANLFSGSVPSAAPAAAAGDPFLAVEAAFGELGAGTAPGISVIGALKNAWARTRASAAEINRARGGRAAGEALSEGADRLLEIVLRFAARRSGMDAVPAGIVLLAMGSYGRRELAPFSDIDLLLLHADGMPESQLEQCVGNFLRPLWDMGLQIGHAVRCPRECLSAMEDSSGGGSALETATSIMEARIVRGDRAFGEKFIQEEMPQFFKRRGRAFVEAKFEEALGRWKGQNVYRTQPNLKESPGALRDFQLALWIDRASHLSGHLPRLKSRPLVSGNAIEDARRGYELLLTFRVALHSICGRKQDVLDYQMQQAVADGLKYESSGELKAAERLLRDYFHAATAVHRLAQTVTRRYLEERAVASRDIERLRRRPVDEDFTRVGDCLYASHSELFTRSDWIEAALRAFLHAARGGISISQDIAEAIRARLPEMNDALRQHPAAAAHFRQLMKLRENAGRTLKSMRDTGLLGAYLPEFGQIEGLVISDVYHDYTVDEHTLLVVDAVDRLFKSVEAPDRFRRGVLEALPRPHVLRYACLFHDLGKSRGAPGHSERGALMVPRIGERLHLPPGDVRAIIFLVQEHLTLSKVSQRRDPGEGGLLKALAEKMQARERLDLLFLLTYCDSISVGHGSYPLWKDALLTELYSGIAAQLAAPAPSDAGTAGVAGVAGVAGMAGATAAADTPAAGGIPAAVPAQMDTEADPGALEARLLAWAGSEDDRTLAAEHCHRVPRRYLVEVGYDEAVSHLEAIKRMRATQREAVAQVRASGELLDMWIASTDRPKRFSQICGAFLGAGVSVVSAIAYTRDDGLILDRFRIAPGLDAAAPGPGFWSKLANDVEETLGGKGGFLARIEAARKRIPRQPAISRRIEPEVRVDNTLSENYTVVDVICGDRIGLLYGLSRALGDLSCDIHFAKIDTNQGLVTDVFYISESGGGHVTEPEKLLNIKRLLKAVAADFQEARR